MPEPGGTGQRRVLYGRRHGPRLRPGRRRLLETLLPELSVTLPTTGRLDPLTLFAGPARPLWLEIGFGGGEHLASLALRHPERGFLGCEPFVNGVAHLLALIEERGLDNVRILVDDARLLLDALPDGCLEGIVVLFPDPWPKARHHKRRIVNAATVAAFARLLRDGGELRLATDHMGYARAMLAALAGRPELRWQARRPWDWRVRPEGWPPTRYEAKALAAGATPVHLSFRKHAAAT